MTFLKKILLLDYDAEITALLRPALERTGEYTIREEHESRHAIDAARWFRPDLILCDVAPQRGTAALLRAIQANPACQDTPVCFVSADSATEGRVVSSGVLSGYSFFASPVRIEEFVRSLAEILSLGGRN